MQFLKDNKKTLLAIIIIIGAFVVYSMFFAGGDEAELLVAEDTTSELVGGELLTLLLTLKSITLDDSIFKRESFLSLVDFSRPLAPEAVGRPNPFAPIGEEGDAGFVNDDDPGLSNIDFAEEPAEEDDSELDEAERRAILDALGI